MSFAPLTDFKATLAVSRIDRLTGRAFSLFILISLYEGWDKFQSQLGVLNLWVAIPLFAGYAAIQIYNVINFWFLSGSLAGYWSHGIIVLVLVCTWPLQLQDVSQIQHGFQPWIWWVTGGGSLAVGLLLPRIAAWIYMAVIPIAWFVLAGTEFAGRVGFLEAIEEASFVALYPATIVTLAHLLRQSARRVDEATEKAALAAAERARVNAMELERSRVDALVHDSVLTTFVVAAQASTETEYRSAKTSAEDALARLERAGEEDGDEVSVFAFMQALTESLQRQVPELQISTTGASARKIPSAVVSAMTDATAQAVANSIQHAGAKAKRHVRLRASDRMLKIVITDNGVGFRPSRIPKSRLGLRLSIIERVERVGGRVYIDSKPGSGTNLILEWDLA